MRKSTLYCMKQALRFILLLTHIAVSTIPTYYMSDYVTTSNDIFVLIAGGVMYLGIVMTIIMHISHFILSFKNKTTQL